MLAVGAIGLGSCVPRGSRALTPTGYFNEAYAYSIRPVAGSANLMADGWEVDNFFGPSDARKAKRAGMYSTTYHLDLDGDGQVDEKLKAQTYDLRFVHRSHSGVIWVRTFPISQTLRDKELRVLMQGYVDSVAGAGYESVDFEDGNVLLEKRFAAELRARQSGTVAAKPAFAAEFAVANIDQLRVTKDARQSLVKVVIVKPGFVYAPRRYWASQDSKGPEFPVLLVIGLAGAPEDFPRALPEFDDLLARVTISGSSGVAFSTLQDSTQTVAAAPDSAKSTPTAGSAAAAPADVIAPTTSAAPIPSPSSPSANGDPVDASKPPGSAPPKQ
jgi:hypothetical protein